MLAGGGVRASRQEKVESGRGPIAEAYFLLSGLSLLFGPPHRSHYSHLPHEGGGNDGAPFAAPLPIHQLSPNQETLP
jgi:hypothetical protein